MRERTSIHVIGDHRVKCVCNRQHASPERQRLAGEIVPRTRSVIPGRRRRNDRQHAGRTARATQDLLAHQPVTIHHRRLLRRQRSGLGEDLIGNADLADVVQQGRNFQIVALRCGNPHAVRPGRAAQRDSQTVMGRRLMLPPQGAIQAARHSQPDFDQLVLGFAIDDRSERRRTLGDFLVELFEE